jgi:DNA invertase Pin-like site-specific DNA recombinase
LLDLVERLTDKGVEFVSKKEAIDTTTPTGKFMLTIFGAVAELEREYILQRQREGIVIAKEQGKYTGRKAKQLPDFDKVVAQWRRGEITAVEAMRTLNMSKSSFYRRVKQATNRSVLGNGNQV